MFNKPFHRLYRPVHSKITNSGYSSWKYATHVKYAKSAQYYVQSYLYIQKELENIFEYIDHSDICEKAYSFKTHSLFIRTCIEVEANFRAIFKENIPPTENEEDWNIDIFRLINQSHRLSQYEVSFPQWKSKKIKIFSPFKKWEGKNSAQDQYKYKLDWYQSYNNSKHDRHNKFNEANLKNLMNAITALLILITSQFKDNTFSAGLPSLALEGNPYYSVRDYGQSATGDLFCIKYPDWPDNEMYSFNWSDIENDENPFLKFDYSQLTT